jgi:hypothetical protein
VAAIAGLVWYLDWAFSALGDVALGKNGWLALGLGVGVSMALGLGLMHLIFFSHRRGYDARAGEKSSAVPTKKRARWRSRI